MSEDELGDYSSVSNDYEDDSGNEERPLKKARYIWQVKGKYHLKEGVSKLNQDIEDASEGNSAMMNGKDINEDEGSSTNNNKTSNDVFDKYSSACCIESLLSHSEAVMNNLDTSNEVSNDGTSNQAEEDSHRNIDQSILDEIPVTLVKTNPKNYDYYMKKWQARQMAKGYLDNTINRVLESWKVSPLVATEFVENCDNNVQVEDKGILMAIQSHGLQSGGADKESSSRLEQETSRVSDEEGSYSQAFQFQNGSVCLLTHRSGSLGTDIRNQNVEMEAGVVNLSAAEENESSFTLIAQQHMNFLDTAVTVAISRKGLASNNNP